MLREGAEPDELEPEELEPDELEPDAPESRESPLKDVDGLAVEELPDEVAAELAPACFAVSPGSWPLTSTPKISAQVARNSVTVRATIASRMLRVRARRAARRGWVAVADMAGRLGPKPKAGLSAV